MLSAAENVGIPLRIEGLRPRERRERVAAMLALTGMTSHAVHSETIRQAATDESGQATLRVELQEEPDHIGIWPDQAAD